MELRAGDLRRAIATTTASSSSPRKSIVTAGGEAGALQRRDGALRGGRRGHHARARTGRRFPSRSSWPARRRSSCRRTPEDGFAIHAEPILAAITRAHQGDRHQLAVQSDRRADLGRGAGGHRRRGRDARPVDDRRSHLREADLRRRCRTTCRASSIDRLRDRTVHLQRRVEGLRDDRLALRLGDRSGDVRSPRSTRCRATRRRTSRRSRRRRRSPRSPARRTSVDDDARRVPRSRRDRGLGVADRGSAVHLRQAARRVLPVSRTPPTRSSRPASARRREFAEALLEEAHVAVTAGEGFDAPGLLPHLVRDLARSAARRRRRASTSSSRDARSRQRGVAGGQVGADAAGARVGRLDSRVTPSSSRRVDARSSACGTARRTDRDIARRYGTRRAADRPPGRPRAAPGRHRTKSRAIARALQRASHAAGRARRRHRLHRRRRAGARRRACSRWSGSTASSRSTRRTCSPSSSPTSSRASCRMPSKRAGCSIRPIPASLKQSSLGGNVAECAGGPRAVKYGTTKRYVLALEAVLPDRRDHPHRLEGREERRRLRPDAAARRIRRARSRSSPRSRCGSCPKPAVQATLQATFADIAAAVRAVSRLLAAASCRRPSSSSIGESLGAVERHLGRAVAPAGHRRDADHRGGRRPRRRRGRSRARVATPAGEPARSTCAARPATEERDAHLGSAPGAVVRAARARAAQDQPRRRRAARPRAGSSSIWSTRVRREHRLLIPCFGHAGDGNIHVNLMVDPGRRRRDARAPRRPSASCSRASSRSKARSAASTASASRRRRISASSCRRTSSR